MGGFKFARQVLIGRHGVDFVCREKYLVVEVVGGKHSESKHDKIRDLALAAKGYRVVRFQNSNVLKNIDRVLEQLYAELRER